MLKSNIFYITLSFIHTYVLSYRPLKNVPGEHITREDTGPVER